MIKYVVVDNTITGDNSSCYAVVSSQETKNLDDLLSLMTEEGSGLTRPQALAYFEKLTQSVMQYASEGYSIATPLFRVRPTICGAFNGKEDKFDPERHQIKIRCSEGQRLRDTPLQINQLEKVNEPLQSPILYSFKDSYSEEENGTITSMGVGVLRGKLLRFDKMDTRLGIFFVPTTHPENKTRVSIYSGVKPSEIHFQIPQLQTGEYQLIIQTVSRSGKRLLSGNLGVNLQVKG